MVGSCCKCYWAGLFNSPRRLLAVFFTVLLAVLIGVSVVGGIQLLVHDNRQLSTLTERLAKLQTELARQQEMHTASLGNIAAELSAFSAAMPDAQKLQAAIAAFSKHGPQPDVLEDRTKLLLGRLDRYEQSRCCLFCLCCC